MVNFFVFWQHLPEKLNPVAFSLGPILISWYGIMYVVAFSIVYCLLRYRIRTEKIEISFETVQDFFPWAIAGLLVGARLGDVFIYDWKYFSVNPLRIFLPLDPYNHWQYIGIYGMSYFGGLIGIAFAFYIFCRVRKINLFEFSDLFVSAVPLAFTFGRIGNFINGELWGRVTTKFWGMYFPMDFSSRLRHPSQLYEAFLEGILLFVILWSIRKRSSPVGHLTAFYLIGYGLARFTAEFFREPDTSWFFNPKTISSGQVFSILIIFVGLFIVILNRTKRINANIIRP
jgi:phosphatidylglycerol---prolipoprotein diacylglyceryl transferase